MRLELTEVHDDSQFPEILEVHRAAFEIPYNKLWTLLYPTHGSGADARATTLADGVDRITKAHGADPDSHWIQVSDHDTKRVVGAAKWIISARNPFEGRPLVVDSFWWPEGEKREFANACMRQFREPRYAKMQRPHVFLNICFTHPEYRGFGVGRMLVEWGLKAADQRALETYVDATEAGKPLYSKYGFAVVDEHHFSAHKAKPGPTWLEMEKMLLPFKWWGMIRAPQI